MTENMKIRLYAREKNVTLWRLAKFLGISEPQIYRNLRNKVDEKSYIEAIDILSTRSKQLEVDVF